MRDLTAGYRPNIRDAYRRDSSRFSVERRELDFKRLAIAVQVDHCANVTSHQAFIRQGCRQDHSIMFSDHLAVLLPGRIRCDQTRCLRVSIDNPDCAHWPLWADLTQRVQFTVNDIFHAVVRR